MTPSQNAQRPLGRSGLATGVLSLGSGTFGREIDEETSWRLLDCAMETGITLIDSAEAYGGGNSQQGRKSSYGVDDVREVTTKMFSGEKILGRWMKDRACRDDVLLCTKVNSGNSAENIARQVQASLERLMTDRIDIYMLPGSSRANTHPPKSARVFQRGRASTFPPLTPTSTSATATFASSIASGTRPKN